MLALFIALAVLLLLVILLLIFYPSIYRKILSNRYINVYGKRIYRIALDNDFYLINQVKLASRSTKSININHLLFGDKYIYLISDYYYRGEILAKENDNSWIFRPRNKKEKSCYIDNPLLISQELVKETSRLTGIDASLFIAITLINNDAIIKGFESKNKSNFLVHLSKVSKLVETIESRDVSPLKEKQLYYAAHDIARLNLNKKK